MRKPATSVKPSRLTGSYGSLVARAISPFAMKPATRAVGFALSCPAVAVTDAFMFHVRKCSAMMRAALANGASPDGAVCQRAMWSRRCEC